MPQTLMKQLVKHEKACCIYSYILDTLDQDAATLAEHLGVDIRSIYKWRKRVSSKEVSCGYGASGLEGCKFK